jgi:hypothetical protein
MNFTDTPIPCRPSSVRSLALFVGIALLGACGGPRPNTPRGDAGGDEAGETEAGVTDAGSGERFRLEVVNGYGSGAYPAGATVHVWSAASTTGEVALPWGGDAPLLSEPTEWHSRFVMPARAVRLVSDTRAQPLTLTVERFNGSTSRPKTVRYHFPARMRGVVLFSHGTGGSNTFIEGAEPFALALALVSAGYGVVGTEAEEAVAGDLNGDGKERWFANAAALRADNIDLQNLQALFANFESRGLIPAGTPKFALGMSAGGAFSHFLGTVGASSAAMDFPQLRFRAVVGYCSDATAARSASLSTTPSAWFMCGAEDNPEVSNAEARENSRMLGARGIPTDYVEHPPSPLYDERFSRIQGISIETSRAMAAELRAAGFVDADGWLNRDGDAIAQFIMQNPRQFPTILRQTDALRAILSQVKAMRAEHAMYADYTQRTVAWFDRFNPSR